MPVFLSASLKKKVSRRVSDPLEDAFDQEDIRFARILTVIAGPLVVGSAAMYELLFAPAFLKEFLPLRVAAALTMILGAFLMRVGSPWLPLLKLSLTALPVAIVWMLAKVPFDVLGIYLSGYILSLFAVSVLVLWRPWTYILWAGVIVSFQLSVMMAFQTPSRSIMATFTSSMIVLILGFGAAALRRQFFVQSFKKNVTIRRQGEKIKTLFANVAHAIFLVKDDRGSGRLVIDDERSSLSESMLGFPPGPLDFERDFVSRLDLSLDVKGQILSVVIASMDEDLMQFELNASLLPSEGILRNVGPGRRDVQIAWSPLLSEEQKVLSLLVSVSDVSEAKSQKLALARQAEEEQRLVEIASLGRRGVVEFMTEAEGFLQRGMQAEAIAQQYLSSPPFRVERIDPCLLEVFFCLHTLKGMTRSLKLSRLTELIHHAEDSLVTMRAQLHQTHPAEGSQIQSSLLNLMQKIQAELAAYREAARKIGWEIEGSRIELGETTWMTLYRCVDAAALKNMVEKGLDEDGGLEEFLACDELRISKVLAKSFDASKSLAKKIGCPLPELHLEGCDQWVSAVVGKELSLILPQIFANALDHGIENEVERLKLGKSPRGHIYVRIQESSAHTVLLDLKDDGRGLSIDKIVAKALAIGAVKTEELAQMGLDQQAMLIFKPGLSTASQVTEISGRGVGMAIVKDTIERLGGRLSIKLGQAYERGRPCPFSLLITLPRSRERTKPAIKAAG